MKKRVFAISLVLMFAGLMAASTAMAGKVDSAAGVLTLKTSSPPLEIGLSPKVIAVYKYESTPVQWYAIGAYHQGGTEAYATAQNFSKVYQKTIVAGSVTADVFGPIPEAKVSATAWTGWSVK